MSNNDPQLMKMRIREIVNDHNSRDKIEEEITFLGFKHYLSKRFKRESRFNDDLEFYFKDKFLLVLDWGNYEWELYSEEAHESLM